MVRHSYGLGVNSPARGGQIEPGNLSEPGCLIDKALLGFSNGRPLPNLPNFMVHGPPSPKKYCGELARSLHSKSNQIKSIELELGYLGILITSSHTG